MASCDRHAPSCSKRWRRSHRRSARRSRGYLTGSPITSMPQRRETPRPEMDWGGLSYAVLIEVDVNGAEPRSGVTAG